MGRGKRAARDHGRSKSTSAGLIGIAGGVIGEAVEAISNYILQSKREQAKDQKGVGTGQQRVFKRVRRLMLLLALPL